MNEEQILKKAEEIKLKRERKEEIDRLQRLLTEKEWSLSVVLEGTWTGRMKRFVSFRSFYIESITALIEKEIEILKEK